MTRLMNIFLRGLVTTLPAVLSIFAVWWLFREAENLLGAGMKQLVSEEAYVPGMGVAAAVLAILAVGVLMDIWVFRRLVGVGESFIERIPLVKTLYNGTRDMMSFFSKSPEDAAGEKQDQVVAVDLGNGVTIMGFVTRHDCTDLPDPIARDGDVAVYIPMSYQIGGFTFLMPRESITPVDLPVEDAMRLAVTAMVTSRRPEEQSIADGGKTTPQPPDPSGESTDAGSDSGNPDQAAPDQSSR
jgi:uncharacterized membrane protein